jgi:hypothetical protein
MFAGEPAIDAGLLSQFRRCASCAEMQVSLLTA